MQFIEAKLESHIRLVSSNEILFVNLVAKELIDKQKNVFNDALIRCFISETTLAVARRLFRSHIEYPNRQPERFYVLGPGFYTYDLANSVVESDNSQGLSLKGQGFRVAVGYNAIVTENKTTNLKTIKIQ